MIEYVNPPIGGGRKPGGPLMAHVAVPTTSGTGSEATTVAVLDVVGEGVKSGISHRFLRATQALVDPDLLATLPPEVASAAGLDVVCHAAESYTAIAFDEREKPADPGERPPYQGANPVADLWSARALEYGGRYLRRAVTDPEDIEARGFMMLAASLAGIGFGSAGVHVPHACAYPIATRRGRLPAGRLPRRPSLRPARALGDRDLAGGVRLHLRGRARNATAASPSCSAAASCPTPARTRCPACWSS